MLQPYATANSPAQGLTEGLDDPGPQPRHADDLVDRADADRPLDGMDPVELRGHLADLLRPHSRLDLPELRVQRGPLGPGGLGRPGLQAGHARVPRRAVAHLAGEYDGRRGRTAEHRGK